MENQNTGPMAGRSLLFFLLIAIFIAVYWSLANLGPSQDAGHVHLLRLHEAEELREAEALLQASEKGHLSQAAERSPTNTTYNGRQLKRQFTNE